MTFASFLFFLVRDAAARLPNGEGTRAEICELLKDSQFLAPDVTSAQAWKSFPFFFSSSLSFFSLCPLSFFTITDDFFVVFDYELTTFQRQTLALSFSLLVTFSMSKELCFPFRWIQLSAGLWIDFTMRKTPVSSMTSAANCGFTCTAIAARKSLVSHKAYFKIFLVYGAALKNSVLFLLNIRIQYSALYEGHYQKTLGAY